MADVLFRETGEFSIRIPACPRLGLPDLQERWPRMVWIEQDESPVKPTTLVLGTFLRSGETCISRKVYERCRLSVLASLLGPQHALWLQEEAELGRIPELTALLRKFYLDFPGMVAVYDGHRCFAYLHGVSGRVDLGWSWSEGDLDSNGRVAFSR